MPEQKSAEQLQRQSHTTHLGETQFRHITKTPFSPRMFPGDTAIIRAENNKMFAEDVKNRCKKIYTDMHTLYAGDVAVITKKMPRIIQATLDCYAGSCRIKLSPTWNRFQRERGITGGTGHNT